MTALDQNPAVPVPPQAAPPQAAPPQTAHGTAMLPRDPRERLAALFDPGTLELLTDGGEERTGVVAGVGQVHGSGAVAFASDVRVQGGAMGTAGGGAILPGL